MNSLQLDRDGPVATLTLNRADAHNAMSLEMIRELRGVLRELEVDRSVRVVVLTGAGESFCAGGDLGWMQKIRQQDRLTREAESGELAQMLQSMNGLPKPLIARVNGQAFGGGLGLIACCDIAIGVDTARFALSEVRLGLIPATISPFVVARIGDAAARRYMLTARRFDAVEACRIGLLAEAVPVHELDAAVQREVQALLQCAPGAVASCKQLLDVVRNHSIDACSEVTPGMLAEVWEAQEAQDGLDAFFARKPAPWIVAEEDQ